MGDTLVEPEAPHSTIPDAEPTVDDRLPLAALAGDAGAPVEPVPATKTAPGEDAPRAPDPPEKKPPPRSRGRAAAIVLAIALAVLAVAGTAVYLFVWRYEPSARRHIPANASAAARLELADVALFGPVRKHLWPRLDGSSNPDDKRRRDRMRALTGVNFATDVREIVIASVDASSWVMVLGGRIQRGRFVHGFMAFTVEQEWSGWWADDLLHGPEVVIGQADDGAIIAGTSESIVRAALPASDEHRHIGLPEDGAAVFAITRQGFTGVSGMLPADAPVLRQIERASGRFTLGSAPRIAISVEPAPGVPPAAVARDLESLFATLRLASFLLPDVAGEKGAIAAAKLKVDGDRVSLEAAWPYEGLDRGCARLAKMLH